MTVNQADLAEAIRLLRTVLRMAPERDFISINGGPSWKEKALALLAKYPERPKLDGCPWCGGEPDIATPLPRSTIRRFYCHNCQVYGPWGTDEADAAAAWNRRAKPASGPVNGGKGE